MSRRPDARVDMYEALPVPFGLVRYGVAPDHPEVKNCQGRFEEIAASPNFRFIGNVSVGRSGHSAEHCTVQLETLMRHYDSILLAYGASEDRQLGIPGEATLGSVYSARQFVGWYNGFPDSAGLAPDLTRGEEAVIIGQGNVALDLARMLLAGVDILRATDITEHALAQLASSRIRRVRVVGRRGPMQAAFTIKEVRELMKLPNVAFHPVQRSLIPDDVRGLPRVPRRLMEVLIKGSHAPSTSTPKSWSLDSCLSPKRFLARNGMPPAVASTEFDVTSLAAPFDPQSRETATGDTLTLPSDIVIRSVGYRAVGLAGFAEAGIRFEEGRGVLDHDGLGRPLRGLYCAGWIKTGPTGVIATTMHDAFATGDAVIQDWQSGRFLGSNQVGAAGGWEAVRQAVGPSAALFVSWDEWRKIDLAERERGERKGKQREKFTGTADMLSVIK
ncbi:uncharacterized protein HRG_04881 [Hirsutella rhossiliensis]|uniref:NADPH:adrenodoxin oxidoreductase, mitochondrial n=1 Tax=Hirsutella rhossiliensis TaxID=111463 RepID=A0A9P8MYM4_9HYPO|nr:uncharacterized protein HRG_04881 [Hirsutella rhossiliensis]KAH0964453.1 hypothetical protein HRG_04881 [Hirsutella rhossiliensis]